MHVWRAKRTDGLTYSAMLFQRICPTSCVCTKALAAEPEPVLMNLAVGFSCGWYSGGC
jgi:hypothetical protein